MAFANIEPLPGCRADLLTGILASLLANLNRDPKKRGDPYTAAEFAPDWWADRPARKTPQEIFLQFRTWAKIAGKRS